MNFELNKEFIGHFIADGNDKHTPYGSFILNQNFTSSLKIHTSFKDRIFEAEGRREFYFGYNRPMFTRIDGNTQIGNIVLLTDGWLSTETSSFAPNMSGYSKYSGFHTTLISKNIDLEKQKQFEFDKIRLRYDNMAYFFGTKIKHLIFELDTESNTTTHQFKYDPKGETLFEASMGEYKLKFCSKLLGAWEGVKYTESEANLNIHEEFFIDLSLPGKKIRLNDIYGLRNTLENLFTFTCGTLCQTDKVVGFQDKEVVDIYFSRRVEEGIRQTKPKTFRLFDSNDFTVHHDRYLTRWHSLCTDFPNLVGYTNSPLYNSIGVENLFLNYVAGIEGYLYKRVRPKIIIDRQKSVEEMANILDKIKTECTFLVQKIYKKIKKPTLDSMQMISLEDQLNRFIDDSNQQILIDLKNNIEIVRKIRNKLAHGDGSVYEYFAKEVNHKNLFPALRLLAVYAIIKEMGFKQSKIRDILMKSLNQ